MEATPSRRYAPHSSRADALSHATRSRHQSRSHPPVRERILFLAVFAVAIFTGAFLLFQVQPLIAKFILPSFGGSPAVWTTAMFFFQASLLSGYAYAHLVVRHLSLQKQAGVHLTLMVAALFVLPIVPVAGWKPTSPGAPTVEILLLLTTSVGLPYFVLAATTPLLQAWFTRLRHGVVPYRYFALSNLGSLLALVSYPFLVEPNLTRTGQAQIWSLGFGLFAVACAASALAVWLHGPASPGTDAPSMDGGEAVPPAGPTQALWLALPAAASVLLLAVTNQISQDIAVVPLLWILPLSLYLLSFIICFDHERWYKRSVFPSALVPAMAAAVWILLRGADASILAQIGVLSLVLFICCMTCHGELARLKPHPRYLTSYYLRIAAGGALGGLFVAFVAPIIFNAYLEFHLGLLACTGLVVLALVADSRSPLNQRWPGWALNGVFVGYGLLLVVLGWNALNAASSYETAERNFFGVVRTTKGWHPKYENGDDYRVMYHGRINHGFQYLGLTSSRKAVSYYGPGTGIELAVSHLPRATGRHIGVVGLGVGTMAAFARQGDEIRFYEINPVVQSVATTLFRYLEQTRAGWEIVVGDGRLSLERELEETGGRGRGYDLLVVDAFSGDAPPVHLLTREAFALYLAHLSDDGVLAVNVTNRHIDMSPVVGGLADAFGLKSVLLENDYIDSTETYAASWMLVARDSAWIERIGLEAGQSPEVVEPRRSGIRLWTDEYTNLFQLLTE